MEQKDFVFYSVLNLKIIYIYIYISPPLDVCGERCPLGGGITPLKSVHSFVSEEFYNH